MKRLGIVFLFSVLVVGCQDQRPATAPDATALPGGIDAAIVDGARAGGNPDFFFLPPLQPSPLRSRNFDRGRFNPNLRPVVKICIGRNITPAGECAVALTKNFQPVVFSAVRGWDGLPDWVDPQQYHVLWQTRNYNLDTKKTYRILVKVGSTLLGFLDIQPTNQLLGALRITAGGQDVGWLDDWIVPIRFRIEQGALSNVSGGRVGTEFTVPASGGSVTLTHLDTALAAVSVPNGALQNSTDEVTIVIAQELPQNGTKCVLATGLVQSDWCYQIRTEPEGYPFRLPVHVEICVDPTPVVQAEQNPADLRVFKYNQTTEQLVQLEWEDPALIGEGCLGPPAPVPGAAGSSAQGILRRLGNWASRLFTPSDLMASGFATPPKGLGGSTTTFSDFGGAVPPALEPQTIDFPQPATPKVYGSTFAVAPTASSELPVTVEATGGCEIAEGTVLMTSGTTACVLTASQAGDAIYAPAPIVVRTVAARKAAQTIVFGALGPKTYGDDPPFTVSATGGTSGNLVTFTAGPPAVCTVSLITVTLTGTGTCTVTARQAGNANYAAAADVPHDFTVAASGGYWEPPVVQNLVSYEAMWNGVLLRYHDFEITNITSYPAGLFVISPDLPPCGLNPNASRTWIEIYSNPSGSLERVYGFCVLTGLSGDFWFAVPATSTETMFRVELWDRYLNRRVSTDVIIPIPSP